MRRKKKIKKFPELSVWYNLRDCTHVAAQGENQTVGIIALFRRMFSGSFSVGEMREEEFPWGKENTAGTRGRDGIMKDPFNNGTSSTHSSAEPPLD